MFKGYVQGYGDLRGILDEEVEYSKAVKLLLVENMRVILEMEE